MDTVIYGSVTAQDLLTAAGIAVFAVLFSKIVSIYMRRALKDRIDLGPLEILVKLLVFAIYTVAVIAIMGYVGINLSGLLVAGGIVGIVVGFASQSIVGNLISGIFLIIERPIQIGDQVHIDGTMGFVEDINIFSTTVRNYDGLFIRLPNEKVFTTSITNYVAHAVRRFEYTVGVRYSDDADRAITIIKELMETEPFVLVSPEPQAFVDNLGDNSVNIIVRIWSPVQVWYSIKMKMLWKIKARLEENGIEIAFPQRVVWFGDRNGPPADVPGDNPPDSGQP